MGWASGSTLTAGVLNGFAPAQAYYGGTQTSWYLGGTLATPVKGLKVGAALDYLNIGATDYGAGDYDYYAWAAAFYANYQVNDKLSFAGRYDYWKWVVIGDQPSTVVTADVQYNLWANVITRLEARWDHTEHGKYFGGNNPYYYTGTIMTTSKTTAAVLKENAFTLALQVIYQF